MDVVDSKKKRSVCFDPNGQPPLTIVAIVALVIQSSSFECPQEAQRILTMLF